MSAAGDRSLLVSLNDCIGSLPLLTKEQRMTTAVRTTALDSRPQSGGL